MLSNAARWPEPNAGWRVGMSGEAYLALDFYVLFASRQKEHKQIVRTPLKSCEALAEQIKNGL